MPLLGSNAVHVLLATYDPGQEPNDDMKSLKNTNGVGQLADPGPETATPATDGVGSIPSGHVTKLLGQLIEGAELQPAVHCTVTLNEALTLLPQLSIAVYNTVVVPSENKSPFS